MPTYDYKCRACGRKSEEFQSIKAAPLRKCSSCGKNAMERLIGTGGAIIFKGSGFYQTDYRGESYRKAAEADKPSVDKPAGDAKAPDAKPADAKAGSGAEAAATKKEVKPSEPSEPRQASKSAAKSGRSPKTAVKGRRKP